MKYIEKVNMKSCARLNEGVWLLACLFILFLCLPLDVFSTTLCTRLGFSHLFVLGCHTSFVTSLWILWGYMFFVVHMVGRGWCHMMLWKSFHDHCERCKVSCLVPVDPCPFARVLVFTSWIDIVLSINDVLHIGKYCLLWRHSSWFGFMNYFFQGVIVTIVIQVMNSLYHDQFPTNMFFPLAMKVFGCLH